MSDLPNEEQATPARRLWHSFLGVFCPLCALVSLVWALLLLSILFVLLEVPLGLEHPTLGEFTILFYQHVLLPIISFFADLLRSLFPWPFIVLVGIGLCLWKTNLLAELFSSIAAFEFAGLKFQGRTRDASTEFRKELDDVRKGMDRINKEIEEAYSTAHVYAAQLRDKYEISQSVATLATNLANLFAPHCPEDYRLTLHIPDFVFDDRLYQFAEYYDNSGKRLSDSRAGRTNSIRYGIIGRVWRSGVPEIEGDLVSPEDRQLMKQKGEDANNPKQLARFIARRWGLTLDEAMYVSRYRSYGAFRLELAAGAIGVVYFDSKAQDAFGETSETRIRQIEALIESSKLLERMVEINREAAPWPTRIRIFKNS